MQGALNSIENVISWMKLNDTPYWRLFSDTAESRNSYPIMSCFKETNIDASAKVLRDTLNMFNHQYGGTFNILLSKSDNPKDNSGPRANIILGASNNTPSVMHGIGSITPDDLEAKLEKVRKETRAEMEREYKHKEQIAELKAEIQGIREDNTSAWSFEKINGIIETAASNPIVQMVLAKAFGLSGLPSMMGSIGENRTDDSQPVDKIDLALETLESAGFENSEDILLGVAQFIKANPVKAMEIFNNAQTQQA